MEMTSTNCKLLTIINYMDTFHVRNIGNNLSNYSENKNILLTIYHLSFKKSIKIKFESSFHKK